MSYPSMAEFLYPGDHKGTISELPEGKPSVVVHITQALSLHCPDVAELDKLIETFTQARVALRKMQHASDVEYLLDAVEAQHAPQCATCQDTRIYQEPGLHLIPCPDCTTATAAETADRLSRCEACDLPVPSEHAMRLQDLTS